MTELQDLTEARPTEDRAIRVEQSLLQRATTGDTEAIETMFGQFIPQDERIIFADYFGLEGLWWVGSHSFGCLTERRMASLRVGKFGEIVYQDGMLEHHNSGIVYQPSILGLYVIAVLFVLVVVIPTFGLGALLFPYVVRAYYRLNKCGLVWVIREGVSVYLITSRRLMSRTNHLYRLALSQRDSLKRR